MPDEFAQDGTVAAFRDSAADFLSAQDQRQRIRALDRAGGPGFDRSRWRALAGQGWFSIAVPEAQGGLGLGLAELCAIATETGRHLLAEPFIEAGVLPVLLLAGLAPGGERDALLLRLGDGRLIMGLAWQESAGQLVPEDPPAATAVRRAGRLALSGRKCFVTPADGVDGWLVCVRLDGETAIVRVMAADLARAPTVVVAVDGSRVAALDLDGCNVAESALLACGPGAFRALAEALEKTRIVQSAELAGIARRALELTRDHLVTRVQFGKPIGSFQALQHRLVDALIAVTIAEAGVADVVRQAAAAGGDALAALASRARSRAASTALEVTRTAIQLHGAIGTTDELDIGLYFRRAVVGASRLGNAARHRRRFAELQRQRLAELHRERFGNLRGRGGAPSSSPDDRDGDGGSSGGARVRADADFCADQDWEAMSEADFRQLARAFLARHYPDERRHLPWRQSWAESRDWYLTLSRLGWLAPAWPKAFGGMGLPADKLIAWIEECEDWGVARPPDQGLNMVGPILMRFGTPEQQACHLPKILAGEQVWTQGYSEPDAGSDLASLRTEAVLDGEHYIVNGQKTWTTWGADGTHMFMLVRTDKRVKPQAGISFLLVDLKTPGITVRPIRNIADESEFCEVFFDDVRVPRGNLVGEPNQGWTIAKALLGFERLFTGSTRHTRHTLHLVETLARRRGLFDDPVFADRFVALQLDTLDHAAAYADFAAIAKRGEPIPPTISMLKIWSTETWERLSLLLVEAGDEYGGLRDPTRTGEVDMHLVAPLFNMMGAKIFAGSNEIQRNILARAVLGLPA